MKLDDFLKCKKVRCVKERGEFLTIGKEYDVLDRRVEIKIIYDEGYSFWFGNDHFEPVLDSAENPLQKMELTPEFEAVEPKFKVGDPVYCPSLLDGRIYKARENNNYLGDGCKLFVANEHEDCFDFEVDGSNQYNNPIVYHANEETRQALQVLHPDIEFEQPPKELKGSDLARAMLDKGWKYVPCYISDSSDTHALERQTRNTAVIIGTHKDHPSFFIYGSGKSFIYYAVPFDLRTGEPLTESVLDE